MRISSGLLLICLVLASCDFDSNGDAGVAPRSVDPEQIEWDLIAGKKGGRGGGGGGMEIISVAVETKIMGAVIDSPPANSVVGDDTYPLGYYPEKFFGCPIATKLCNKITVTVTGVGTSDTVYRSMQHAVTNTTCDSTPGNICFRDESLVNAFRSRMASMPASFPISGSAQDMIDNGDGTKTFTYHWQGQRKRRVYHAEGVFEDIWYFAPDQKGASDYWALFFSWSNASGSTYRSGYRPVCGTGDPKCWADFDGPTAAPIYVTRDRVVLENARQGGGKGKNRTSPNPATVRFELQGFDKEWPAYNYADPLVVASNVGMYGNVMMKFGSTRTMVSSWSIGVPHDDDLEKGNRIYTLGYGIALESGAGCYSFDLIGAAVTSKTGTPDDAREETYSWQGIGPEPLSVSVDESGAASLGCGS